MRAPTLRGQGVLANETVLASIASAVGARVDDMRLEIVAELEKALKPVLDAIDTGPHKLIPNKSASFMWFRSGSDCAVACCAILV